MCIILKNSYKFDKIMVVRTLLILYHFIAANSTLTIIILVLNIKGSYQLAHWKMPTVMQESRT